MYIVYLLSTRQVIGFQHVPLGPGDYDPGVVGVLQVRQVLTFMLDPGNPTILTQEFIDQALVQTAELAEAPRTAKEFFAASPAAIAFIRSTPAEQAAQIDAMTTAQLKTAIKYLTVAVSAIIKERYLNGQ